MMPETMAWEGQEFPVVECDSDRLPESLPSMQGLLLHVHKDHEARYPQAALTHQLQDLSLHARASRRSVGEPERFPANAIASVTKDRRSTDNLKTHDI